jgi:hypothetical protein
MPAERPPAIQHDPSLVREDIAGPDAVTAPYPVYLQGWVTRGFGRGSKDLGCPTANLPDSSIEGVPLETGVHFGFARVLCTGEHDAVFPMVMSIGWNPFYNNDTRTAVRALAVLALCPSLTSRPRDRRYTSCTTTPLISTARNSVSSSSATSGQSTTMPRWVRDLETVSLACETDYPSSRRRPDQGYQPRQGCRPELGRV